MYMAEIIHNITFHININKVLSDISVISHIFFYPKPGPLDPDSLLYQYKTWRFQDYHGDSLSISFFTPIDYCKNRVAPRTKGTDIGSNNFRYLSGINVID